MTKHHHQSHKDDQNHNKEAANSLKESQGDVEQDGTEASEPKASVKEMITLSLVEFEHLKKESAEYKDKYLRLLAEGENARKRLQKEKLEMIQFSIQNLIAEFLHPIDHLENALKFTQEMSNDVKHWAVGFQMILKQFQDVLANNGVTPIDSLGKVFDPHWHEAVEIIETVDYPAETIVEEFIKGYKMGDKLVRAARVKVAKKPIEKPAETQENQQQDLNNK